MPRLFCCLCDQWLLSAPKTVIFVFLSIGTGMLIHGIHWIVLAWLENGPDRKTPRPARESFWHQRRLVLQIAVSPLKAVLELIWVLWAPNIDRLTMEENAPYIPQESMPVFNFLQDFYLHFGQFYAHMSYALLFSFPFIFWGWAVLGFAVRRILFLLLLYMLASLLFLMGRVQLGSLFKAEMAIRSPAKDD